MFVAAAVITLIACDRGQPDATGDATSDPFPVALADANGPAPDSLIAIAQLRDSAGAPRGKARLFLRGAAVVVHLKVTGLAPGLHGVHVHETGVCDARRAFESAGAHLNPQNVAHGLHSPSGGHAGDLPNLDVDQDGTGSLRFEATDLTVGTRAGELFDRNGSALVIHADADDQVTDPSGNSGARIACGIVTRT